MKSKTILTIVAIILVITLAIIILYKPAPGITIQTCKHILNYECIEQTNQFAKGEKIWLLMHVTNLKANNQNEITYKEERTITHDNTLIKEASGKILEETKKVPKKGNYNIPIANQLITDKTDATGKYEITIKITDNNTKKTKQATIKITLT